MKYAFALLVVCAFVLGCTTTEKITAEEIVEKMKEKYDSIADYKASIFLKEIADGRAISAEGELMFKKPDKFKICFSNYSSCMAFNGKETWIYNKTRKEAFVFPGNRTDRKGLVIEYGSLLDNLPEYNISIAGKDTVNGRDCYLLEFEPKKKNMMQIRRIWVDSKEWYVLRTEIVIKPDKTFRELNPSLPENTTVIFEYKQVDFDANIGDDEFELKLPGDVNLTVYNFTRYSLAN